MGITRRTILAGLSASVASRLSHAAYPDRPIRLVVPYAPAGGADIVTRAVAHQLGEKIKQSIIVENRSGADGLIGADYVAKSAPDGYTFLSVTSGHQLLPFLHKRMPYDTLKDLVAVTALARSPALFVASGSVPANSLQELAALIRANPGKYSYGSAEKYGLLINTMWNQREGLEAVHIPYKGSGQQLPDIIGGSVQYGVTSIPAARGYVQSGQLKALAVTSAERVRELPQVPTAVESGLKDFVIYNHYGLYAPANTPKSILERLQGQIAEVTALPALQAFFALQSVERAAVPVTEFQQQMLREFNLLEKLAKEANLVAS